MADLISVTEAIMRTRLSRATIIDKIRAGEIKGQKVDNFWLIDKASFEEWLAKRNQSKAEHSDQSGEGDQGEPTDKAEASAHA